MKRTQFIALLFAGAALFMGGCATIKVSREGKTMVEVQNNGWYLLNCIPIASGDTEYPNSHTCKIFRDSVDLDNNIDMIDWAVRKEGAVGVRELITYTNDEYVFVILLRRHSMHTSAELVMPEDAHDVPDLQIVEKRSVRVAKSEEEAQKQAEEKALEEASKPPKKEPQRPRESEKNEDKIKLLEF